ncbi:MAG: VWA domain-containing protein [Polyangiaceae bacterium]|nr:VWA domain-containing protein [Polyangiaceae bacterium]
MLSVRNTAIGPKASNVASGRRQSREENIPHSMDRSRFSLCARSILPLFVMLAAGGCEAFPELVQGPSSALDDAAETNPLMQGNSSQSGLQGGLGLGGAGAVFSSSGNAPESCDESEEAADLVPANLLFVVDKSGSMECNAPPIDVNCEDPVRVEPGSASKWEMTQAALTGSNGALPTLAGQAGISAGLMLFPLDSACEVPANGELTIPIQPLSSSQLTSIQSGLEVAPSGATPLAGATIRGLEAIRLGIHAGDLEGDNYLVVMTDGAETCQPDALTGLLSIVEEAREYYGIRTYAIGAPGSEGSRTLLSKIANAGGTRTTADCSLEPANAGESCHIDLTESEDIDADLGSEFKGITEETTQSCEYDVPQNALVDKNKVNVEYTPTGESKRLILQDPRDQGAEQCADAEGWQYSEDGSKIVLCGAVCDDVLADPGAQVRVVFGCRNSIVR